MRSPLLRTLVVGLTAATALVLPAVSAQASAPVKEHDTVQTSAPDGDAGVLVIKLTHSEATSRLRASGITWSSSGGCSDRYNSTCTSFEQVNLATIQGAQTLKTASGCALNITGGTEVGHASGTYSHWNGYKLDYSLTTCIQNYVTRNFTYIGGNQWRSGSGNIYYRESNHWDVTY
ncbi:MAG TPA: hypothetical protein VGD43_02350, partial [Micromonospora sp.]